MPIYEFRCRECGKKFTMLLSISERERAQCPACASKNVIPLVSTCSFKVGESGGRSCNSTRGNRGYG